MDETFGIIDCNNFYVSCERLFRPDLEGKPVIVLSNNDGCAVARSADYVESAGLSIFADSSHSHFPRGAVGSSCLGHVDRASIGTNQTARLFHRMDLLRWNLWSTRSKFSSSC